MFKILEVSIKNQLAEEENYALPQSFLMEMMELNEKLTEVDPETFKQEVAALETEQYEVVKDIIENYNDATITPDQLLKIKEYYFKKKYLHRILDRIDD